MPVIVFVVGLLVGSFLNVCIYRIPRAESVVIPRSHCPRCSTHLSFMDLIPVLSYILLGRRCRYCGVTISSRYAIVEMLTATLFLISYLMYGPTLKFLVYLYLISVFIIVSFIDIDYQIIPDGISISGIFLGFFLSLATTPYATFALPSFYVKPEDSLIGILAGGGILWFISIISRGGMGGGDVKLAALIGAFLGWKSVLTGLLLACFLGAIVGMTLILLKRKGRKDFIPFGPYIALGTLVVMFAGVNSIISWYNDLILGMSGL